MSSPSDNPLADVPRQDGRKAAGTRERVLGAGHFGAFGDVHPETTLDEQGLGQGAKFGHVFTEDEAA